MNLKMSENKIPFFFDDVCLILLILVIKQILWPSHFLLNFVFPSEMRLLCLLHKLFAFLQRSFLIFFPLIADFWTYFLTHTGSFGCQK